MEEKSMNRNDENKLILAIKTHPMFTRLAKVTTMLPPPRLFTNRYIHTFDVIKVANIINAKVVNKYKLIKPINLKVSCLAHDLGHCCFAHETEEVVNKFLSFKLCLPISKICFSHAVNGALVLAISSKPNNFSSNFSNFKLFSNSAYISDAAIIVDSVIKHAFNESYLDGVYFKFIESQYKHYTGRSLIKAGVNNSIPLFQTGYYVRVSDNIATKNSDILDLFELYHSRKISRRSGTYYTLCHKYVNDIALHSRDIKSGICTIEDVLKGDALLKAEANLLKQTYSFQYKQSITNEVQKTVENALEVISEKPWLLKSCGFNQRYSYIQKVFKAYASKITNIKELNKANLDRVKKEYYSNPHDDSNPYVLIYRQYICAVTYELTNFTDKDFISFAMILASKTQDMAPISTYLINLF